MEYLEDYDFTLHYHPGKANVVADALIRKAQGVLAIVASRGWHMLKTVGQFRLQYSEQAQGVLGSLVAMPFLLSRVIESQGHDIKIVSIKDQVQSSTGGEGWAIHTYGNLRYRGHVMVSPVDRSKKGDPRGVPLLSIFCASKWHEDVP